MALLHLSDTNFRQEVLEAAVPVVVDFSATWCGPCKLLTPILEELVKEYEGKIKMGRLDVEENPRITAQYGIMSVPTLIFFKNGQLITQTTGVLSKAELKKKIKENL